MESDMSLNELHANCRQISWPEVTKESASEMNLSEVLGEYSGYAPENFNFMAMETALVNSMHIVAVSNTEIWPAREPGHRPRVRRTYWARRARLKLKNAA